MNGENVADGVGITPKLAKKLFEFGADAITLGNHTWRRPEVVGWIDTDERVVRPANFSKVEQQALARYTPDAGTHVAIEVQPAATLAIP